MSGILFVDDDSISLRLMTRAVELLGHEVICEPSPRRALLKAAADQPVAILVDLQMFEMNGIQFMRELRKNLTTANIPAFIYTASIDPVERKEAMAAGATGVLLKPLDFDELKKIIDAHIVPSADE